MCRQTSVQSLQCVDYGTEPVVCGLYTAYSVWTSVQSLYTSPTVYTVASGLTYKVCIQKGQAVKELGASVLM